MPELVFSENINNEAYLYNEQSDDKIPQFDGNDTLDNNQVIDVITNTSVDVRTSGKRWGEP